MERTRLLILLVWCIAVISGLTVFLNAQKFSQRFLAKTFTTKIDSFIPFLPQFVWIYSFFYYFMIAAVPFLVSSLHQALIVIGGGVIILFTGCLVYMFFPVKCPSEFRQYNVSSPSTRFLSIIQKYDVGRACIPSMHCAIASYSSCFFFHTLGFYAIGTVALISLSCLFVKQHQLLDLPPGILLGYLGYILINYLFL